MEEKYLESLVAGLTKTLIEESKLIFKGIAGTSYDEVKQYIGRDLKNYLSKHRDRYSYIKTLLRGNTPVFLYDIYFPSKLLDGNKVISTESSIDFFNSYSCVTIIGDAGSGKSTLVKHLFLNSIYERKYIPILIELRYLNESSESLEGYIKNTCQLNKVNVNDRILERLLDKGKFVFFFDGFDELEEKIKQRVINEINNFVNKYASNKFIITTRPYSNIESLPLFTNLKMMDLTINGGEIKGFVFKQLSQEIELAEKAYKSISQGDTRHIESFLKNPLLLSLYLLTFQSHASIPDKKYIFYRRVVNALFSEHDSKTKLGFIREKQCGLDQEGFEDILKSFSFLSYFEDQFAFDRDYVNNKISLIKKKKDITFDTNLFLQDLKLTISLWVDDDGQLSFSHRSLQEYFCALFISELKDDANERVYDKVVKHFDDGGERPTKEIDSLLTLLKELDEYNYTKKFYLPLLQDLTDLMSINSLNSGGEILVDFFVEAIAIDHNTIRHNDQPKRFPLLRLRRKPTIFKTIFVHIPFTLRLNEYLHKEIRKNHELITLIKSKSKTKRRDFDKIELRGGEEVISLGEIGFEDVYKHLDHNFLDDLYSQLISHLNQEIKRAKKFIKKIEDNEKDLVDLI